MDGMEGMDGMDAAMERRVERAAVAKS
jgi:hypothetical protein